MPRPSKKPVQPEDLPVLTELSDSSLDIPVLTEAVVEEMRGSAAPQPGMALTDEQCRQLAIRLAPQLEALLREKLARQFEGLWQESWREVESNLPELIRDHLAKRARNAQ